MTPEEYSLLMGMDYSSMPYGSVSVEEYPPENLQQYWQGLNRHAESRLSNYQDLPNQPTLDQLSELSQYFAPGLLVYHGSGANFGKFSDEFIGSGQGAASYGHGHYVAQARPVGEEYYRQLAPRSWAVEDEAANALKWADQGTLVEGKPFTIQSALRSIDGEIWENRRQWKEWSDQMQKVNSEWGQGAVSLDPNVIAPIKNRLANITKRYNDLMKAKAILEGKPREQIPIVGGVYAADLSDEAIPKMLDWDAPVSMQTTDVKKQLSRMGYWNEDLYNRWLHGVTPSERHVLEDRFARSIPVTRSGIAGFDMPGQDVYESLVTKYRGPGNEIPTFPQTYLGNIRDAQKQASQELLRGGTTGVRYADAESREFKQEVLNARKRVRDLEAALRRGPDGGKKEWTARDVWGSVAGTKHWPEMSYNRADMERILNEAVDHLDELEDIANEKKKLTHNFVVFDPALLEVLRKEPGYEILKKLPYRSPPAKLRYP